MYSLYVPYAMSMKKMKNSFYCIALYTMTYYARKIYVFQKIYL